MTSDPDPGSGNAITIDEAYSYDAYGVMLGGNPARGSSPATNLLYAGEQFDTDMQQYYLRARYYDQNIGRFNRMDPFGGNRQDPQSLHKYLYCHANPVNNVDPSGRVTIMEKIAVFAMRFLFFPPTTLLGLLGRAAFGTSIKGYVAYYIQKIVPPLVDELRIFSWQVSKWGQLGRHLAGKAWELAQHFEETARDNLFWFCLAPLTSQIRIVHGSIIGYQVYDFFRVLFEVQALLIQGVTLAISLSAGLELYGHAFGVNADVTVKGWLEPHSLWKIAKGLRKGDIVPADGVWTATELLTAVERLDRNLAEQRLDELKAHISKYGELHIEGNIEAQFIWRKN